MILKGRYCILEQIGQGGEGCLYLARDMELGSLWAVKEIPVSRKKEAKLLRLLSHPYMPKMVDYLEKGEFCYLVMEYVQGKSLGWYLEQGRKFSKEEILDYGISVAQVIGYLHSRKPPVYYGDLKPDNIMLSEAGKICLVDFGSAVWGYCDRQSVCMGTKGFAAPEQYEGKMGVGSDVYTFGKTLWVLLGRQKWKWLFQEPELFRVILKCCRASEKRRYDSMEKVEKALSAIRSKGKRRGILPVIFCTAIILIIIYPVKRSGRPFHLVFVGKEFVNKETAMEFETALTRVTDLYYEEEFLNGDTKERVFICKKAEKELQEMQKVYQEKAQQQRILLLLAGNAQCQEEYENAEFYYEQLLLYDPEYYEGYGEYGLFLLWRGEREKSEKLWEKYAGAVQNAEMEAAKKSRNLKLWEAEMNETMEEEK
jgi:serine/threonine-protein kinase